MSSLIILILILFAGSVVTYFLSVRNRKWGAWFNFALTIYALWTVWFVNVDGTKVDFFRILPNIESVFIPTNLGKYFAFVSMIVIASVALFIVEWIEKKPKTGAAFNFFYVIMLVGIVGVFFAGDLLTLYVFWEIMMLGSLLIVPMGKEESKRAAIVYLVISAIGSYMYLYATFLAFNRYGTVEINKVVQYLTSETSLMYKWIIVLFIVAAGIAKSGVFPLHTWLRITHGTAPDAFSAVLSGQLVKMGSYIVALTLSIFPSLKLFKAVYSGVPTFNYLMIIFGAVSIIIGTFMAIRQNDMKMLIAYSSVANGGYILIGLATMDTIGYAGGLFHVFNHAIAAAMIFLSFAAVIYRTGTTKIDEMGGLIHRMPWTFVTYLVGIISLAGIPPTSGFISKWMIFNVLVRKGMFITAAIAFVGSIGSFLYVFRPLAGVFLGQLRPKYEKVEEVPWIMLIPMLFLVLLTVFVGVFPGPLLDMISNVQNEVGIAPIDHTLVLIKTPIGQWNTFIVFVMFAVGFAIAVALYLLFPKPKNVELMNQYTGGEYLYTPDLYHYATKFYRFIERWYDKHPSFEKLYEMLAKFFKDVGEWVSNWFYLSSPSAYAFWVVITLLIIYWVR